MDKHIIGNWKMNLDSASVKALIQGLTAGLAGTSPAVKVGFSPSFPYLTQALEWAKGGPVLIGAQNCHENEKGAFTGEVSVPMLNDIAVDFVIIGHSERRNVFGESEQRLQAKVQAALAGSLQVILCVGEKLDQRDAGQHERVVGDQIKSALAGVSAEQMAKVWLAYEPVWAIGTGRTATPEQAGAMHKVIRDLLAELYNEATAQNTPILYGGSVKPTNAADLLSTPNIDGALVGGASLKTESFLAIIQAAPNS